VKGQCSAAPVSDYGKYIDRPIRGGREEKYGAPGTSSDVPEARNSRAGRGRNGGHRYLSLRKSI